MNASLEKSIHSVIDQIETLLEEAGDDIANQFGRRKQLNELNSALYELREMMAKPEEPAEILAVSKVTSNLKVVYGPIQDYDDRVLGSLEFDPYSTYQILKITDPNQRELEMDLHILCNGDGITVSVYDRIAQDIGDQIVGYAVWNDFYTAEEAKADNDSDS